MLDDDLFDHERPAAVYLYRLRTDDHDQTAVLCQVATDAYDAGMVRIHEQIRTDRASHLADHLEIVGVQSSPIAMAFRDQPVIAGVIERVLAHSAPLLSFRSEDGLQQDVYPIDHDDDVDAVLELLADQPLYLIDGHHRAAAASIHQARRIAAGEEPGGSMLAALFPAGDLRNLAFHRIVKGVDDDIARRLSGRLADRFEVRQTADPSVVAHRNPNEIAMARLDPDHPTGPPIWTLIGLPFTGEEAGNRLADLEPVRLNRAILEPMLGLDEAEAGDRIAYRPGTDDVEAITALRPEPDELIFVMRAVPMSTLLAVADRGQVMPPKSTYFQPKVRSGIFLRTVADG